MDRLYIPGIILHLSIVANTFYCNDNTVTEFYNENSFTAYIILYELIDFFLDLDSNRRVGVWSLPWRWHILSIPLTTGRGTGADTYRMDNVFPPDDLGSVQKFCYYMYMHSLYEFCYRTSYTYSRSVIHYWRSCTPSHSIGLYFWGVRGSWVECQFMFSFVYQLCLALW